MHYETFDSKLEMLGFEQASVWLWRKKLSHNTVTVWAKHTLLKVRMFRKNRGENVELIFKDVERKDLWGILKTFEEMNPEKV